MISTNDRLLNQCRPSDLSWDGFMLNCEEAINTPDLHSDEISSDDEALAKEEREAKKRPERIFNTNSVIKVHDKKWRSMRVCKVCEVIFKNYNSTEKKIIRYDTNNNLYL
jgi:hypothetical protein